MAKYQKTKDEVNRFLEDVKAIILKGANVQINNKPWKGNRVNKTLTYMAETGISFEDIKNVIYELKLSNYSYTADETNSNFKDEQVWIFGITKNMVDKEQDLYIKLKIRVFEDKLLLIMSFHPEEPRIYDKKLKFPYKE